MFEVKSGVDIYCPSWTELKKYFNGEHKEGKLQYAHDGNGYNVFTSENGIITRFYLMDKDKSSILGDGKAENDSAYDDFVDNYKASANTTSFLPVMIADYAGLRNSRVCQREYFLQTAVGINPTVLELSFPYNTSLVCGRLLCDWANYNKNDKLCAWGIPPNSGVVGIITDDVASGKTIPVSPTVTQYTLPGDFVMLGSDTTKYEVASVDDNEITLCDDLGSAKNENDVVMLYIPRLIDVRVLPNAEQYLCDRSCGGALFPSGYTMRLEYWHNTTPDSVVDMSITVVYFHGK